MKLSQYLRKNLLDFFILTTALFVLGRESLEAYLSSGTEITELTFYVTAFGASVMTLQIGYSWLFQNHVKRDSLYKNIFFKFGLLCTISLHHFYNKMSIVLITLPFLYIGDIERAEHLVLCCLIFMIGVSGIFTAQGLEAYVRVIEKKIEASSYKLKY